MARTLNFNTEMVVRCAISGAYVSPYLVCGKYGEIGNLNRGAMPVKQMCRYSCVRKGIGGRLEDGSYRRANLIHGTTVAWRQTENGKQGLYQTLRIPHRHGNSLKALILLGDCKSLAQKHSRRSGS